MKRQIARRRVLAGIGAVLGVVPVAGCVSEPGEESATADGDGELNRGGTGDGESTTRRPTTRRSTPSAYEVTERATASSSGDAGTTAGEGAETTTTGPAETASAPVTDRGTGSPEDEHVTDVAVTIETADRPAWPAYLDDVREQSYEDRRGAEEVRITAKETYFDPSLVRVDAGTTVTWEFITPAHNVKFRDSPDEGVEGTAGGEFDVVEEGETFSVTLATPGTYTYYCAPHEAQGMKGAIRVE